jgi:hypothetical protein
VADDTERLKILVEERRFYLSRMMQAVAIYLALLAFAIRTMIGAVSPNDPDYSADVTILVMGIALTLVQGFAWYVTRQLRTIIDRLSESILSRSGDTDTASFDERHRVLVNKGTRMVYPTLVVAQVIIIGVVLQALL